MTPVTLAFDTAQPWVDAALIDAGGRAHVRIVEMARGQAEALVPTLEQLLADHGLGWADLQAIGVGTGPGNFTGIRISVAAARGLAMALKIPAIGISAFESAGLPEAPCWIAVEAPRDQVYLQYTGDAPPPARLAARSELAGLEEPVRYLRDVAPERRIENIARLAAERSLTTSARPAPLYIRPADAAPPRHPAPVILT
ncbi:MAG TPA: tRNA (adenosine(37)-N6)-threonylcarbamoyltransferase complex dimerization subunit type 1 TsaB [Rhodobacteraceae bacterium]|nr:tRNA (adenosine(37)-N6)-threonylcarbamoyltransferase complex dimerization subunit type 1 TsaB [Paracoccaceae bacterium]